MIVDAAVHFESILEFIFAAPRVGLLDFGQTLVDETLAAKTGIDGHHEQQINLVEERLDGGDGGGWEGFARDNPALLDPGLLRRFYPGGQLDSERARRIFLLPRVPLE